MYPQKPSAAHTFEQQSTSEVQEKSSGVHEKLPSGPPLALPPQPTP